MDLTINEKHLETINDTLDDLRNLLRDKGQEYIRNNDPFHNFNEASKKGKGHPLHAIEMFRLKHEISIDDIRTDLVNGEQVKKYRVEEKYNDILLYYLLEKSMILNQYYNQII